MSCADAGSQEKQGWQKQKGESEVMKGEEWWSVQNRGDN
jgi:hypothetical protein